MLEKEAVRSVFVETVWTKDMVDASFVLHRQPEGNELLQLKESACFDYFIEVLHDVVGMMLYVIRNEIIVRT